MGSDGFEPPKLAQLIYSQPQLSTLATAPESDFGVSQPRFRGADDGTRTRNRLFTKQLLCQLSYVGKATLAVPTPTGIIEIGPKCVKEFRPFRQGDLADSSRIRSGDFECRASYL